MDIDLLKKMRHSPVRNYAVPGLTSWLVGEPGPNGCVRNFWRPVADHLSGYECPCVEHEPAMVEDKGDYVWRGLTP